MTLTPSYDIEALVKRLQDRCVTLSQKNRELEQALADAREALKPFADWHNGYSHVVEEYRVAPYGHGRYIRVRDLRRAARALNAHHEKTDAYAVQNHPDNQWPHAIPETTKNPIAAPASPTSKGA